MQKQFKGPFEENSIQFGGVIYLHQKPSDFVAQMERRYALITGGGANIEGLATEHTEDLLTHVSTDHIISVVDLLTDDIDELAKHALGGMAPEYNISHGTLKSLQGSVLVAGEQFGIGSSREQAVSCLLAAGIEAVLAPSFGGTFLVNAINLGLLTSTDINQAKRIQKGESVPMQIFLEGKLPLQQEIIRCGGLLQYLQKIRQDTRVKSKIRNKSQQMNIFEKRIAQLLHLKSIQRKDKVFLPVDRAYSYVALSGPARQAMMRAYGKVKRTLPADKIFFFEDHFALSNKAVIPQLTKNQRAFAKELEVPRENYYFGRLGEGGGAGISHRVMLESTDPRKNRIVVATDSHTPTLGALPLIAIPIGSTNFASAIAEGFMPFAIPGTMRVNLTGKLPRGLTIRDAQLAIAAKTKVPMGTGIIEFGGNGFRRLRFDEVVALCNMVPEIFLGAEIAVTELYTAGRIFLCTQWEMSKEQAEELYPFADANALYTDTIFFNLSKTTPWIALPGRPSAGVSLAELEDHPKINKAYIISCTNGLDEIAQAAAVMIDQKVADHVSFIVMPSSQAILERAKQKGFIHILQKAGVTVRFEIACSACVGDGTDAVEDGDIVISATNRNFQGRMGHKGGKVYLGGAILTALSALLGRIPTEKEFYDHIGRITDHITSFTTEGM